MFWILFAFMMCIYCKALCNFFEMFYINYIIIIHNNNKKTKNKYKNNNTPSRTPQHNQLQHHKSENFCSVLSFSQCNILLLCFGLLVE